MPGSQSKEAQGVKQIMQPGLEKNMTDDAPAASVAITAVVPAVASVADRPTMHTASPLAAIAPHKGLLPFFQSYPTQCNATHRIWPTFSLMLLPFSASTGIFPSWISTDWMFAARFCLCKWKSFPQGERRVTHARLFLSFYRFANFEVVSNTPAWFIAKFRVGKLIIPLVSIDE